MWCFLDTWTEYAEGNIAYFVRFDPVRAVVIPVMCIVAVLTAAGVVAWQLVDKFRLREHPAVSVLFLAACLIPFGIAAVAALRVLPFNGIGLVRNPVFWPRVFLIASVPLGFILRRPRRAARAVCGVFLYSWPILLIVLVNAGWNSLRYGAAAYADGPQAVTLASPPSPVRVVWIIFDEASQTIAFGNRPSDLRLPHLDRFKEGSFYATSAHPPADSTKFSMPSLILGQTVTEVMPHGARELRVRAERQNEWQALSSMRNVFDDARDAGLNTAVAGWYLPYGRTLNRSLTKSYWIAGWQSPGVEEGFYPQSLASAMWQRVCLQFSAIPLVGHLPGVHPGQYQRHQKAEQFVWLRNQAVELAADPTIGLTLIHLPIPHPPGLYNRPGSGSSADYLDNLALADRTLGMLRQVMEQSGLWDRTAILVSADHGWRIQLWRGDAEWTPEEEAASHQDTSGVPFLLKLPGQANGLVYSKPFSTIVTRELIGAILSGKLSDPADIGPLIEARSR